MVKEKSDKQWGLLSMTNVVLKIEVSTKVEILRGHFLIHSVLARGHCYLANFVFDGFK